MYVHAFAKGLGDEIELLSLHTLGLFKTFKILNRPSTIINIDIHFIPCAIFCYCFENWKTALKHQIARVD